VVADCHLVERAAELGLEDREALGQSLALGGEVGGGCLLGHFTETTLGSPDWEPT